MLFYCLEKEAIASYPIYKDSSADDNDLSKVFPVSIYIPILSNF